MITFQELRKMHACASLLEPPADVELRRALDEVFELHEQLSTLRRAMMDIDGRLACGDEHSVTLIVPAQIWTDFRKALGESLEMMHAANEDK